MEEERKRSILTLPAKVAAVRHGCVPSYLPMATVRAHILLLSRSENIGTSMLMTS